MKEKVNHSTKKKEKANRTVDELKVCWAITKLLI